MSTTPDDVLNILADLETDKENGIPTLLKPVVSYVMDVENISSGDVIKFRFVGSNTGSYQYGIVVAVDQDAITLRTDVKDYVISASLLTDSIEVSQHLRGE